MAPDVVGHVGGVDGPYPVPVGALLDVLAFEGVYAAVEGDVDLAERDAGRGGEVFGDGDLDVGLSGNPPRPCDDMADWLCHDASDARATAA